MAETTMQFPNNSPTLVTTHANPGQELAPSTLEEKVTAMERKMDEQAQNMQILMQMIREMRENNGNNTDSPRNNSELVNSTSPQASAGRSMVAINFLLFLSPVCYLLDEILRWVGENSGAMFSFLKSFKIDLGIDLSKIFDISPKPDVPPNFLLNVGYCLTVMVLCLAYIGISRRPSLNSLRLRGVVAIFSVGIFLWNHLSGVPLQYQAIIPMVLAVFLFVYKKMIT